MRIIFGMVMFGNLYSFSTDSAMQSNKGWLRIVHSTVHSSYSSYRTAFKRLIKSPIHNYAVKSFCLQCHDQWAPIPLFYIQHCATGERVNLIRLCSVQHLMLKVNMALMITSGMFYCREQYIYIWTFPVQRFCLISWLHIKYVNTRLDLDLNPSLMSAVIICSAAW